MKTLLKIAAWAGRVTWRLKVAHERTRLRWRQRRFAEGKMTADQVMDGYELRANPSCRKCHGRGFIGVNAAGNGIPCKCARAVRVGKGKTETNRKEATA